MVDKSKLKNFFLPSCTEHLINGLSAFSTKLGHRVKYGLDHFLDHFSDYFFGPFLDYFFEPFLGPFYRGGSTPLVLREGWDAVY